MSPTFSIYLDAIRFLAALTVFLAHAQAPHRGALQLGGFPAWRLANDAVVTFFVLSGLVIHYSVDHRDCEIATYIINRLARLWSVVIPAPRWHPDTMPNTPLRLRSHRFSAVHSLFINCGFSSCRRHRMHPSGRWGLRLGTILFLVALSSFGVGRAWRRSGSRRRQWGRRS